MSSTDIPINPEDQFEDGDPRDERVTERNPAIQTDPENRFIDDDDEEFDDAEDFDDEPLEDESSGKKRKKSLKMHCFSCNRQEGHSLAYKKRWFYSFFVGLSFGLAFIIGPFQCRCCGHSRLMNRDLLNPRYWIRPQGSTSGRRKKKRRRSSSR